MEQNFIEIKTGDDVVLTIRFTDSAGTAIDITGATVFFTVKEKVEDAEIAAVIAIDQDTHIDPTGGITTITIASADSEDIEPGQYVYDIRLKTAGNSISTTDSGLVRVIQTITRRTS